MSHRCFLEAHRGSASSSSHDNMNIRLCVDFGFAQYMSPWDEQQALRGSPLYMAPEMVCRRHYDARVDLWSVGVILYGETQTSHLIIDKKYK